MSLAKHIADRLTALGATAAVKGREVVVVTVDEVTTRLRIEDGANEAFEAYKRARISTFDVDDLSYTHNATVELPLVRLNPDIYRDTDDITFADERGNTVTIQRASRQYMFAHFDSSDYKQYYEKIVKVRLKRFQVMYTRHANILWRTPVCATYADSGQCTPANLKALAQEKIRSCLVKLAIERHACYELARPKTLSPVGMLDAINESDWSIPRVVYEPHLVSYYKVARSSPFASQSFLAYYHVLEYYFLKVTEDALHHQLRTYLNRSDFKATTDGLDRVIALIRRQGSTDDETDMLRKVLQRFIAEDDFILYVNTLEVQVGEKLYTKRRTIFGEPLEISLREGHALSNAAKVLKQIRNAIVHSSDRYKRDECHIPLTDSEDTIGEFIPLVKYFAEQVLYGTGVPAEF